MTSRAHVPNGIVLLFIVDLHIVSLKFGMGNINPILETTISENSIIIERLKVKSILIISSKKKFADRFVRWTFAICNIPSCHLLDFILFELKFVILHVYLRRYIVYSNSIIFLMKLFSYYKKKKWSICKLWIYLLWCHSWF